MFAGKKEESCTVGQEPKRRKDLNNRRKKTKEIEDVIAIRNKKDISFKRESNTSCSISERRITIRVPVLQLECSVKKLMVYGRQLMVKELLDDRQMMDSSFVNLETLSKMVHSGIEGVIS